MLGVTRTDMDQPDWFLDPATGRRSAPEAYAFSIDQRDEAAVGNIKQVWEVNRLQHLTLLAVAWHLTGKDEYAERVAEQLRSWWRENPYLSGVHWTSGIEVGIRLISFAWIRRLLNDWPPVADLFEHNDLAVRQIRWHQEYLAAFESRGSSANNHVIAEAAGQLAASCAFPWFPRAPAGDGTHYCSLTVNWRITRSLPGSTVSLPPTTTASSPSSGSLPRSRQRRPARRYPRAPGRCWPPWSTRWRRSWTSSCARRARATRTRDEWSCSTRPSTTGGRPCCRSAPRCSAGSTGGRRLVPDMPSGCWPAAMLGAKQAIDGRPAHRPSRFADAGITILRTEADRSPEIWCRLDAGPHGFLSIAAHAHADALSMEVRYAGVDVLADPGTYCYHGEREWRSYFRSTIAHNTVEVGGLSQSTEGGAFMWLRQARSWWIPSSDPATSTGSGSTMAIKRSSRRSGTAGRSGLTPPPAQSRSPM